MTQNHNIIAITANKLSKLCIFMQIKKLNEKIQEEQAATKSVYVLTQDIKSGQVITSDLFSMKTVRAEGVPVNATSDIATMLQNYSLFYIYANNGTKSVL